MAEFDKGARYLAKQDSAGFFAWLWRHVSTPLVFHSWLDARRLALPIEGDLTCDTVAAFSLPGQPEPTHTLIVDFKAQARSEALEQLLGYVVRLRTERPHAGVVVPPQVGGVLLNLSGPPQRRTIAVDFPGVPECDWHFSILQRTLREEAAEATLADITAGRTTRWILPWIPLMNGGDAVAIMEAWKRTAEAEPDERVRATLAGLALVFAELADRADAWKENLEGWNVLKSKVVEEWRQSARVETSQELLLDLLEERFGTLPGELVQRVNAVTDLPRLKGAVRQVLHLQSLDQLQL